MCVMTYRIRFDFPEQAEPLWAGWCGNGTLGYAPTTATAAEWETEEIAERVLANSYGSESASYGRAEKT